MSALPLGPPADARVRFDHVSLDFQTPTGPLRVVDDVTYDIRDGDFVAVIGPSGCGKTTMMSMLAGFQKPSAGHVLLDGRPVEGPGPERGVIFQEYGVFPWLTVEQNIAFGLKLKANRVSAAERAETCRRYLDLMGLTAFARAYPKHLSGGMRQRLAIARAYAVKPQFLLMDEPFGALDAQTRSNMQNLLLDILAVERKTVMLITHSVEEAIYLASRIVVVTARPARVRAIIEVPFGYPRDEAIHERREFGEMRSHIRDLVMDEYRAQQGQIRPTSLQNDNQHREDTMRRRDLLAGTAAVAGAALARPALAQAKTKVRVGYLHTVAVDGQIWTGLDRGSFAKQGLEFDMKLFNTGLEIFQALIGGSLDVLATGAVLSNFPARGQGKAFLINDIEVATAHLWVRGDQGIKTFADLKGKRIATAVGTTAHVFLDRALRANKIDPKEVEIVNQPMPAAVTAFISGAVPAVALWVPFNITVRDKVPGAVKLADASAYYPQAAIIGGWAAGNDYYAGNQEVLGRIAKGWAEANDFMVANSDEALKQLQAKHYENVPLSDLQEQFKAQKMFTSKEWKRYYADGTVTKWLEQSTDFFMANAGVTNFTKASEYFDPKIYLNAVA